MDNPLKESYRIGKILKKLSGIKFLKSKQTSDISSNGKALANNYNKKKISTTTLPNASPDATESSATHTDKYLRYQKELEASKMLGSENKPMPPGRIPKLSTGRKEIMSQSEE